MTAADISVVSIAGALCTLSFTKSTHYWFSNIRDGYRTFDECIADIRAMNQYNSWFLAGSIIFLGLIIEKGNVELSDTATLLIVASLITASAAIFFIPLQKPGCSLISMRPKSMRSKQLWLSTLILSQWTIILMLSGVIYGVLSRI